MAKFQRNYRKFSIYRREVVNGEPHYWLKDENGYPYPLCVESYIEPYTEPQDITELIKTFEDAKDWCAKNGYEHLVEDWCITTPYYEEKAKDISAYLKLRIITCALNEGWEPTFEGDEERWFPCFNQETGRIMAECSEHYIDSSARLMYKTQELAEYAAAQFKDIYMDFCYKGKE